MLAAISFLQFRVDDLTLCVALSAVRRVVRSTSITPLPGAPPNVCGVLNISGVLCPVYDARPRFGRPSRRVAVTDLFLVVTARGLPGVLWVDAVVGVIVPAPSERFDVGALVVDPSVVGIARQRDGLVVIHDLEAFLADAGAKQLEASLADFERRAE
jgi:purine-binding chemotaxis protein CheW